MIDPRTVLRHLLGLTRTLQDVDDLEAQLKAITDATLALLPGEHASIRLLDDSRTELLCGARSGAGEEHKPVSFQPGEGIVGWVIERGELVRIGDVSQDDRFAKRGEQGFSVRSLLALPLLSGNDVIGVLATVNSQPDAFTADHETLGQLLANCAIPPIERTRLKRLALMDDHTSAFNRRYMEPRLAGEMARARKFITPLSLLFMKPDGFDEFNDKNGAEAGDRLLRLVASRVRSNIRTKDVLIRRMGVAFALLMPDTGSKAARRVAERVQIGVKERAIPIDRKTSIDVTLSIGNVTWDARESSDKFEMRARKAMKEARASSPGLIIDG